jgi:hypothetical protein
LCASFLSNRGLSLKQTAALSTAEIGMTIAYLKRAPSTVSGFAPNEEFALPSDGVDGYTLQ